MAFANMESGRKPGRCCLNSFYELSGKSAKDKDTILLNHLASSTLEAGSWTSRHVENDTWNGALQIPRECEILLIGFR
jgi:hypothetical protein